MRTRITFDLVKGMTMHLKNKNMPRFDGPFVTGTEAVQKTFKSEGEHHLDFPVLHKFEMVMNNVIMLALHF